MKAACRLLFLVFVIIALLGVCAALETQSRADAIAADAQRNKDSGIASVFLATIATSRLHYLWSFTWGAATVAAVLFGALVVSDAIAATSPPTPSVYALAESIARAGARVKDSFARSAPPVQAATLKRDDRSNSEGGGGNS